MTTRRWAKRVATRVASSSILLYPKKNFESLLWTPPFASLYRSSSAGRRDGGKWDSMCSSASLIRWWRNKHWMIHVFSVSACWTSATQTDRFMSICFHWHPCGMWLVSAGCSYVTSCIKRICLGIICQKEETLGDVFLSGFPRLFHGRGSSQLGRNEHWLLDGKGSAAVTGHVCVL